MATFNGTPGPDVLRAGAEADILNGAPAATSCSVRATTIR
jgi:hypothetical protein